MKTSATPNRESGGLLPHQVEMRRTGIGASEVAVLAGLSRWASPISIWESKVRGFGWLGSYQADLGVELENPFARIWARNNGRTVVRVDTIRHPIYPFAIATPDRAIYPHGAAPKSEPRVVHIEDDEVPGRQRMLALYSDVSDSEGLLQIKSSNWRMRRFWGAPGTDEVPSEYYCQCVWEGAVAGVDEVRLIVDFDKTSLLEYRVPVKASVFEMLYELADRFMRDHVLPQVPPAPDFTERYEAFLNREFPRPSNRKEPPRVLRADEDHVYAAVELWAKLEQAAERIKKLRQQARNTIGAAIGTGTGIGGDWGKVTWLDVKESTRTDWESYATDLQSFAGLLLGSVNAESRPSLERTLREMREKHQYQVKSKRVMRRTFAPKGPLDFSAPELELRLNKLGAGTVQIVEEEAVLNAEEPTKEGTEHDDEE